MTDATEMAERHARALGELTELGLALARRLAARAEDAATLEEAQVLALAFHRVSRAVRLTVALEAKTQRDRRRTESEDRMAAAEDRRLGLKTRKAQVRAALVREVLAESDEDEVEDLIEDLDERLEEDALYDDFLGDPLELRIARIREDLGLGASPAANDAGAPAAEAPSPIAPPITPSAAPSG